MLALVNPEVWIMANALPFGEVLEAADHLSQDEQEELIAILRRRLAQAGRQRVAREIQEARLELGEGRCVPVAPGDVVRELLK